MSGIERIEQAFKQGRPAFMPYAVLGYPDRQSGLESIRTLAEAGADLIELGIPFSDPLADGPTIQAASQVALNNGITLESGLQAIRELRGRGVTQPMLLFSYLNPLLAYGAERIVTEAKAAGADGFIIPDLPPEEAHLFAETCEREGMALVFFLAPTSNSERIKLASQHATGFIYVVSLTGITGARTELPAYLKDFIGRLRAETDAKLVMGFGISKPDHARMMTGLVDGFIVGSALVRAVEQGLDAVHDLAKTLREAL